MNLWKAEVDCDILSAIFNNGIYLMQKACRIIDDEQIITCVTV